MGKIFLNIANLLSFPTEVPKPYGAFHIVTLILAVILTVFLTCILRNGDKRTEKRLFLIASAIIIAGELYKQLVLSFEKGYFEYNIYFFPMQFCSTPLYVYPLAFFVKNRKLYDGAVFYSATYCLFAGIIVLLYPGSVFCAFNGINVQSLFHHGVMVAVGSALLVRHYRKFSKKSFLYGTVIFLFFLLVAIAFNFAFGEKVNMYYLNPLSPVKVPIVSGLIEWLPYPIAVSVYAIFFSLIAFLISGTALL